MPYIKQERRDALASDYDGPQNAGELNYLITKMLIQEDDADVVYTKVRYIINAYMLIHGMSYQRLNDVFGALVGAEREYERRMAGSVGLFDATKYRNPLGRLLDHFYLEVAAPYEDEKIKENGDVYVGH